MFMIAAICPVSKHKIRKSSVKLVVSDNGHFKISQLIYQKTSDNIYCHYVLYIDINQNLLQYWFKNKHDS